MSQRFQASEPARLAWLQEHQFRRTFECCGDARENDVCARTGLPDGLADTNRSAGCRDNSLGSIVYKNRVKGANERYQETHIPDLTGAGEILHPMAEMRFVTAHHSVSSPLYNSCAAWGHKTEEALAHLRVHTASLNTAFYGSMVAILTLADTDGDALTVYGPQGEISVERYAREAMNGRLAQTILERVRRVFPNDWEQIAALREPAWREVFHTELTECLVANAIYVRRQQETHRPIEHLTHQERLLFIGRLDREGRDAFFIEDREGSVTERQVGIGLPFVAANIIADAIALNQRVGAIPVLIGIPHDPTSTSKAVETAYTKEMWHGDRMNIRGLLRYIEDSGEIIHERVQELLANRHHAAIPHHMSTRSWGALVAEKIAACICVYNRETRYLVPVE